MAAGQTLRRNLVWNGGFEDVEEIVQPCSVWISSPTGSRARIPYLALTPTLRWRGVGIDTLWETIFYSDPNPPFQSRHCGTQRYPYPQSYARVRVVRGEDGSFLYGPLYYMPWQRVAAMCDSGGVEVWGWSLDTARILRDRGSILYPFSDLNGKPWPGLRLPSPPTSPQYYPPLTARVWHPGSGLVVPDWGTPDTVSVRTYYRASYEPYPFQYQMRGVWAGHTRRAFQGIQHVAPGWVAMWGQPAFQLLPEQHEGLPVSIATSRQADGGWIPAGFTLPDTTGRSLEQALRYNLLFTPRSHIGEGYNPSAVFNYYRYGLLVSPWRWGILYSSLPSSLTVSVTLTATAFGTSLGGVNYNGVGGLPWYGAIPDIPREAVGDKSYLLAHAPRRLHRYGEPFVVGGPSRVGRLPALRSSGFLAPIQPAAVALALGAVPYDSLTDSVAGVTALTFYPSYTLFGRRSDSMFVGRLRESFLATTWGIFAWMTSPGLGGGDGSRFYILHAHGSRRWSVLGEGGTLYFSPVLSLTGQGQSSPVWHHRRIPYYWWRVGEGKVIRMDYHCGSPCPLYGGCSNLLTADGHAVGTVSILDSLRWAMRPGARCAPLQPYKGEGYMTLTYPVRELHGFRSSVEYRAFLRAMSQRFRVRERLWDHPRYRIEKDIITTPVNNTVVWVRPPCSSVYPASWCEEYFRTIQALWDTVLNRASVRCGAPTFLSDFRQHFMWELYMVAMDTFLRRVGEDLGLSRDSIRARALGSCCGAWWNARTELGGSRIYPYERYRWKPVWKWGPQGWIYPTTGCPDRPELRLRGLDPECSGHTFCAGRCPELRFGYTPMDTFLFQSKWYFDSLMYFTLDSFQVSRQWSNLLRYWRYSRTMDFPWGWDYFLGCGRYAQYPFMYDSTNMWDTRPLYVWLRPNPVIGGRRGWTRTGAPDMLHAWYWSYRYPDAGCFISLNHGDVDQCCGDAPYRVNRAYAIMGYLVDTLKAGRKYKVRMAVAVPEWSRYVINNIGVVVSREPIPNVYPYCREGYLHEVSISWEYPEFLSKSRWAWWENRSVRLDSVAVGRWVVLEGELEAKGGERFIYVGWLDSVRLDTVYRGEEEPIWRNGWLQRCLGETGYIDWVWDRLHSGADSTGGGAWPGRDEGLSDPVQELRWWVQRWISGGEASLHIDEVELWEMDEPLGGRVSVEHGVCGGRGRGRVEVWGGVAPYRCFWDRPGISGRMEGCEVEGLEAGWWRVRVIDSTGAELVEWVEIRSTPEVRLEVVRIEPVRLGSGVAGRAIVRVVGGTAPYQVWWSPVGVAGETLEVRRGGRYVVWVRDSVGCVDRLEVEIPEEGGQVWVPSAFSPNGDGVNDVAAPVIGGEVWYYRWRIWDRWGKQVFESRQVGEPWRGLYNGQPVPEDAYVWVLEVGFVGEETITVKRGTITIIR